MIALAVLVLAALGSLLLALGMERHHRRLFRKTPSARNRLSARWLGGCMLLISLGLTVLHDGAAVGFVQWMIALGLGATAVGFALPLLESAFNRRAGVTLHHRRRSSDSTPPRG